MSICLNMIVKNESKIIERLLKSTLSVIDTYCICDTGSTDNTQEIITNFFDKHNIKGKIVNEPFKNFCHNRNFALKACLGMSDYVLLLDADMILQNEGFNKDELKAATGFSLIQKSGSLQYHNLRLVKNIEGVEYKGVTHEYLNTPKGSTLKILKSLYINDIGDGGSKADKFERDIRLLTQGIKDEPNNSRYYFYLANSYRDLSKYNEAIEFYKKRIEMGGWEEEVWYSHYRIGLCYEEKGNMVEAINSWMNAYEVMPARLENIYRIIKYYRENGKNKLASMFYFIAIQILDKKLDRSLHLFLESDVYTWRIYNEYTIFAYYIKIKNINDEALIVFNNCSNKSHIKSLLSNMKFYQDILTPLSKKSLNTTNEIINKIKTTYEYVKNETNEINKTNEILKILKKKEMPQIFSNVRGSSCSFNYKDEIWFVTHMVSYEKEKHYYHLLVVFDKNMNLLRYTAPFKFEGKPVEYCLNLNVEDNHVLMTYSRSDNTSNIGIYDKEYIENKFYKMKKD